MFDLLRKGYSIETKIKRESVNKTARIFFHPNNIENFSLLIGIYFITAFRY